ncbi:hypothetical protein [Haloparvum sedimenti]|uniref:hypothetical protein n=1 Tax=Haloparvum sedimenti TaxID=1678448 RepID=UPI00071E83B5|nr:hypothetical protein [Haloparvum sedimenti]
MADRPPTSEDELSRNGYGVIVVLMWSALMRSALMRSALMRSALMRSALMRSALMRSALMRSARAREAAGRPRCGVSGALPHAGGQRELVSRAALRFRGRPATEVGEA